MTRHVISVLGVVISFCLLPACTGRKSRDATETPVRIRVRKPNQIDRPVFVRASGTVEPNETAHVAFLVAGQVAKVFADEGSMVRAGQPLAELDTRDYDFRLRAAAAQVEAARANVDKADSAVRKQELALAKVDFDRTEDEYNRYKALFERQSLAPADFKKIEAAYLAATERYSLAQEGARREDRGAARQALEAAVAQAGIARKALADTKLTAPIGGLIARREVEVGDPAGQGRPVFIIMNLNPAKVRVGVPESEIGRIRQGQSAAVQIPSLGEKPFDGRVETIGYAADPMSRTFSVKIAVRNPNLELRAGMIAESHIQTDGRTRATTVPAQSIVRDPQGATLVYVYFPDKKQVYQRRVDVGTVFDREVEISRGLTGEELVVVAGQHLLTEGALATAEDTAQ